VIGTTNIIPSVQTRRRRHADRNPSHSRSSVMNTTTSNETGEPDSDTYVCLNKDNAESELQTNSGLNEAMLSSTISSTTTSNPEIYTTTTTPNRILYNFVFMSILFSSNHGCVVACLSLATARLGSLGAYQNGLLYVTITKNGPH
jgi:hypothetical protein